MERVALQSAHVRIGFYAEADLLITDAQVIDCMEELEILTDGEKIIYARSSGDLVGSIPLPTLLTSE